MMLLRDEDIYKLLKAKTPLITNIPIIPDDYGKDSSVQPASLDLHVGKIYVPEVKPDEFGGIKNPRLNCVLEPGHTAVVETKEILDIPPDIAAIGFPPSHVSAQGLLTTNPGHVDPGYSGHLSLTIINMGRTAYELRNGDAIVTLVLLRMPVAAHAPYGTRRAGQLVDSAVSEDRLSRLSKDFLQVEVRAERAAKSEESKTRRWAVAAPALIAAIAVVGTLLGAWVQSNSALAKQVQDQETQISVLRQQIADISAGRKVVDTASLKPSYRKDGH